MALLDPEGCLALHLNFPTCPPPLLNKGIFATISTILDVLLPSFRLEKEEISIISEAPLTSLLDTGYFHVQSTKPNSLAVAMGDSPVGLAAWIIEKYHSWTKTRRNSTENSAVVEQTDHEKFLRVFPYAELLDLIHLYWFSTPINNVYLAGARYYYEQFYSRNSLMKSLDFFIPQPVVYADFPQEPLKIPRKWLSFYWNVVEVRKFSSGGHFPALEVAEEFAKSVHQFAQKYVEPLMKQKLGGTQQQKSQEKAEL
jgi:hypothetical protein